MSTNLSATALSGGMANPETAVNDAVGDLDAALTEVATLDLTNSLTCPTLTYQRAIKLLINPAGVTKTLTLPAVKRFILIENQGGNDVTVAHGATSFSLPNTSAALVYTDGTTNGLTFWLLASSTAPVPYDVGMFLSGAPSVSQIILRFNVVRAFTLPISLTGSKATAGAASTGTATFTIKNNGASIGTVVFTASATATFTFAAAVTFAAGDIITITAPASVDATLSDVAINFKGTR